MQFPGARWRRPSFTGESHFNREYLSPSDFRTLKRNIPSPSFPPGQYRSTELLHARPRSDLDQTYTRQSIDDAFVEYYPLDDAARRGGEDRKPTAASPKIFESAEQYVKLGYHRRRGSFRPRRPAVSRLRTPNRPPSERSQRSSTGNDTTRRGGDRSAVPGRSASG